ncbi:carbon-nitrogen hydrolase [Amanita rubescens]|nr:carbon-nitrogen hydrolase [Amanita rubescens]
MGLDDPPHFKPFTIVLDNKQANLSKARDMIFRAAAGNLKPDLIVLPELFNCPYGQVEDYSEVIDYTPEKPYDALNSPSETVRILARAAMETRTWLVGEVLFQSVSKIKAKDSNDDSKDLYNTSTVYNPQGQLIALYHKVHLFEGDIPSDKITLKIIAPTKFEQESDIFDAGNEELAIFDTDFARIGCQLLIYPAAFNTVTGPLHCKILQHGHSMVVDPIMAINRTQVLAEAGEDEEIIYAKIGEIQTF